MITFPITEAWKIYQSADTGIEAIHELVRSAAAFFDNRGDLARQNTFLKRVEAAKIQFKFL